MFPAFETDPFTNPQARRSFIKYSISENDWLNRSGNSILSELSDLGVGIRRQDFYEVRREKLFELERKKQFGVLGQDELIPYALMNEDTNIELSMNVQYRLRLTVIDPETGDLSYVYRALSSDEHYTKGYVEEFAEAMFSMGGEGYNYQIVETVLHDVWLTPGSSLTG